MSYKHRHESKSLTERIKCLPSKHYIYTQSNFTIAEYIKQHNEDSER